MKRYFTYIWVLVSVLLLGACTDELPNPSDPGADSAGVISLSGEITQITVSRANDSGFANGDVMGVYVVDYEGIKAGQLKVSGNRGDNVRHTFNETSYSWKSAYDLYWKDKHTRIDVYGYYPYSSPESVEAYEFRVRTNQHLIPDDGTMGDYEASDFLWGKVGGVEPTTNVIRLPLAHRMANARITLVEGTGFEEGEWAALDKQVLVTNTVHTAAINLATGTVAPSGSVAKTAIVPSKRGNEWRAIVVPQTVGAGTGLFSITLGGIPYTYARTLPFTYVSGKMSNFSIKVNKKAATGDYSLSLVGESITPWEDDVVSHDGAAKEYVVVNSTPGGLKDAITEANKDYREIKNLKITGAIHATDFDFMRTEMPRLQALNLKEVEIMEYSTRGEQYPADWIPKQAFYKSTNLQRIILPDKLKGIGMHAFAAATYLSGSLVIPEGVTVVDIAAFSGCRSLNGTLTLPATLRELRGASFSGCGFSCELKLPESLEVIDWDCFLDCNGLYGSLKLPERLTTLGSNAFNSCSHLTGSLEIPAGITTVQARTFSRCGFNGNLRLHDGIEIIGQEAFAFDKFKGELSLPKNLVIIDESAFADCDFSGTLVLPKSLRTISSAAFTNNHRLTGTLEIAEGVEVIGSSAFANCSSLEGVRLPSTLDHIGSGAFGNCVRLNSIVCKSDIPPYLGANAFSGVPKDNFVVEVPEASVAAYKTAVGWNEFKRVSAHRQLVCRPSVACALGTMHRQTIVVDAEGDWEVESLPYWCSLSQEEGSKKTELTLTIQEYPDGSEPREGDIVFNLKRKGYTSTCHVTQYPYTYGEDEFITLQKATKGRNGGINIVLVGDGYNARNIADGSYLKDMTDAMEMFFAVEPYTTYRPYFNVYTGFALSGESGVGCVNTVVYNRFNTTYTAGTGLQCDYDELFGYIMNAPGIGPRNIDRSLVILIPNSTDYGGITHMWSSGASVAICPKSADVYPYDSRGIIQHEAGGHAFGKLADEYIYHNAFITSCDCTDCGHEKEVYEGKVLGWYDNIDLTGKTHKVGWSHLIFDPRYSDIVDVYEGAFGHSRGVYRSEQNSCMNNNIPYFSTISRESIVKRIKLYAGEDYNFEEFVALDKRASKVMSRGVAFGADAASGVRSMAPVIHKGAVPRGKSLSSKRIRK